MTGPGRKVLRVLLGGGGLGGGDTGVYRGPRQEAYGTRYSQAVSHPGTDRARPCLASEIGRDRACSGWYGRKRRSLPELGYLNRLKIQ